MQPPSKLMPSHHIPNVLRKQPTMRWIPMRSETEHRKSAESPQTGRHRNVHRVHGSAGGHATKEFTTRDGGSRGKVFHGTVITLFEFEGRTSSMAAILW